MILNLTSGKYNLRFRYDLASRFTRSKRKFLQSTAILEKPDGNSITAIVLAHRTDKNASRRKGRELALEKLLKDVDPAFRADIMNAYDDAIEAARDATTNL